MKHDVDIRKDVYVDVLIVTCHDDIKSWSAHDEGSGVGSTHDEVHGCCAPPERTYSTLNGGFVLPLAIQM